MLLNAAKFGWAQTPRLLGARQCRAGAIFLAAVTRSMPEARLSRAWPSSDTVGHLRRAPGSRMGKEIGVFGLRQAGGPHPLPARGLRPFIRSSVLNTHHVSTPSPRPPTSPRGPPSWEQPACAACIRAYLGRPPHAARIPMRARQDGSPQDSRRVLPLVCRRGSAARDIWRGKLSPGGLRLASLTSVPADPPPEIVSIPRARFCDFAYWPLLRALARATCLVRFRRKRCTPSEPQPLL